MLSSSFHGCPSFVTHARCATSCWLRLLKSPPCGLSNCTTYGAKDNGYSAAVNCAFWERFPVDSSQSVGWVKGLIHQAVAHDGLHILASLGIRNRLNELRNILVVPAGHPLPNRNIPRVISRKSVLLLSAIAIDHLTKIDRSQLQIRGRV